MGTLNGRGIMSPFLKSFFYTFAMVVGAQIVVPFLIEFVYPADIYEEYKGGIMVI